MRDINTDLLNDRDLLYGGVVDQVEENAASARRWARMVALHARRPATDGNFAMSSREWVALEVSEVWAMGDQHARSQLNVALFLAEHLPEVWAMCLAGELDRYRATTVADILRHRLDDPAHWAVAAARVTAFLRKHRRRFEEFNISLVTCTVTQLRNRLNYVVRCLVTADEEFARSYADRTVHAREVEEGIGLVSITTSVDQARLVEHRLRLSARAVRAAGDPRTVEQLMSDLAVDLLVGRAEGVPVPGFARPVINVTVPYATLAGISDEPGVLSGGSVIPADLARAIATREGATWYRLLTDPAGEPVAGSGALSTKSYQPTEAIWRYVVATRPTCSHEACDRPSVECELDHRDPWPGGATSTENLDPLCRRHHKAKHARAERPDLDWEYAA